MDQILNGTSPGEVIFTAPGDYSSGLTFSADGTKVAFSSEDVLPSDRQFIWDVFVENFTTHQIETVSTDSSGLGADGHSWDGVISSDGSKVLFESTASNLAPGDDNNCTDVFIKDLNAGSVTRVSTDSAGLEGNGNSYQGSFIADGSKVLFASRAANLSADDTNHADDVYIKDLVTGVTTQVSGPDGGTSPTASPDGSKVSFLTFANGTADVVVKDLSSGLTALVSSGPADGADVWNRTAISWMDSTHILFTKPEATLDANGFQLFNVFIEDLITGAVMLVSDDPLTNDYAWNSSASSNGTRIALTAGYVWDGPVGHDQSNVFIKDLSTNATTSVSGLANQSVVLAGMSDDGDKVAFASAGIHSHFNTLSVVSVSGADTLRGGDGNDTLSGNGGNDYLEGGDGADIIDGGTGFNVASYAGASHFVVVDLALQGQWQDTQGAGADLITNVENLVGSDFNDTLSGDGQTNVIHAGAGDDTLYGRAGDDNLFGEAGNDYLDGGDGADVIDGGAGFNVASYASASSFVVVDLNMQGTWQDTQGAGADLITNVENLIGSDFDDNLTGDGQDNVIYGGNGNDTLYGKSGNDNLFGGNGNDYIDGGPGNDSLTGNSGSDAFVFGASFGHDTVTDFTASGVGHDRILLLASMFADFAAVQSHMIQSGSDVIISHGSGDTLTLSNVLTTDLTAGDFTFV